MAGILTKTESEVSEMREYWRVQDEREREREEQERIIREQKERVEKERAAFKDLYLQAKRWQRARFIREYNNAFEKNAVENDVLTDETQNWLGWAQDKADWYDPMINKGDLLLKNSDKDVF